MSNRLVYALLRDNIEYRVTVADWQNDRTATGTLAVSTRSP